METPCIQIKLNEPPVTSFEIRIGALISHSWPWVRLGCESGCNSSVFPKKIPLKTGQWVVGTTRRTQREAHSLVRPLLHNHTYTALYIQHGQSNRRRRLRRQSVDPEFAKVALMHMNVTATSLFATAIISDLHVRLIIRSRTNLWDLVWYLSKCQLV